MQFTKGSSVSSATRFVGQRRWVRRLAGMQIACLLAAAPAIAELLPAAPQLALDFEPNRFHDVRVATTPDGFVAAWRYDDVFVPFDRVLAGGLLDHDGYPVGSPFVVAQDDEISVDNESFDVAANASGDFLVFFAGPGANFIRAYDATGAPVTSHVPVHSYPATSPRPFCKIVSDGGSTFVALWRATPNNYLLAQRFDELGTPVGANVVLSSGAGAFGTPEEVDATFDGDGNLLAAWLDFTDTDTRKVFARRFSPAGTPLGPVVEIGTTGSLLHPPQVIARPGGAMTVFWRGPSTSDPLVVVTHAQSFDSAGMPIAPAAADLPPSSELFPLDPVRLREAAAHASGVHLATEASALRQEMSPDAAPASIVSLDAALDVVNTPLAMRELRGDDSGYPRNPAMAVDAEGDALVLWTQDSSNGTQPTLAGRRFCAAGSPDCDLCVAADDDVDTDGDDVADGCDPCTQLAPPSDVVTAKLAATAARSSGGAGITRLRYSATAVLATAFSGLALDVTGARFVLVSGTYGDQFLNIDAAPTGWVRSGNQRRWIYRRRAAGKIFTSIKLTERPLIPNHVHVRVVDRSQPEILTLKDAPVLARIVFGDDTAPAAGLCDERLFATGECSTQPSIGPTGDGVDLSCRVR